MAITAFDEIHIIEHDTQIQVIFHRPEVGNAFDDDMIAKLASVFNEINNLRTRKIIQLQGAGKHFSAGADLRWMQRMADYSREDNLKDAQKLSVLLQLIYHCPHPTIALLHGAVYGGALGVVAACDFALAAADTRFCFSEVKIGLIPAVISPYVIKAIGEKHAKQLFLTAEVFNAQHAKLIGLVNQVVEHDQLASQSEHLSQTLMGNAPLAVREAKKLVNRVSDALYEPKLLDELAAHIADIRASEEGQLGLKAFLTKSPAPWSMPDDK